MMAALQLTWCARGEVIDTEDCLGSVERQMIMSPCDHPTRSYSCVICRRQLANVGQILMHIEQGGAHRVASWWPAHRVFESAPQTQVEAFAQIIAREVAT
jgi:hypothetical protein